MAWFIFFIFIFLVCLKKSFGVGGNYKEERKTWLRLNTVWIIINKKLGVIHIAKNTLINISKSKFQVDKPKCMYKNKNFKNLEKNIEKIFVISLKVGEDFLEKIHTSQATKKKNG